MPANASIPPFGETEMEITARPNDITTFSDVLELFVAESRGRKHVNLKATGHGSTIVFEPPMTCTLNVGQQLDVVPFRKIFKVRNSGRRQQRLVWSIEDIVQTVGSPLVCASSLVLHDIKHILPRPS